MSDPTWLPVALLDAVTPPATGTVVSRYDWLALCASRLDGLGVKVATLHRPRRDLYGHIQCLGCDQGCSCDCPEWPCATATTILEHLDIDAEDITMPPAEE